jgi:hypothetical protein
MVAITVTTADWLRLSHHYHIWSSALRSCFLGRAIESKLVLGALAPDVGPPRPAGFSILPGLFHGKRYSVSRIESFPAGQAGENNWLWFGVRVEG